MSKILSKIQNLPEEKRKIILWTTVIIFAFLMIFFWLRNLQKRLQLLQERETKTELNLPDLEATKIEMLDFSEQELKNLEELLKEIEKESEKESEKIENNS